MSAAAAGGSATNLLPGSICVKTGFEQHYGECWNDVLSMLLIFADGYKEVIQPLLLNTEDHSVLINAFIDKIDVSPSERTKLYNMLEEYLQFLSYRFQYHIQYIQESGNGTPKRNRSLRRLSLRCSLKTATGLLEIFEFLRKHDKINKLGINDSMSVFLLSIGGKIPTGAERNWVGYAPVGTFYFVRHGLLYLLHNIFGITNKKLISKFDKNGFFYLIDSRSVGEEHVIGVFKCNGVWYLYDDNMVILKELTPFITEEELTTQLMKYYEELGIKFEIESIRTVISNKGMGGGRRTHRHRRMRRTRKRM